MRIKKNVLQKMVKMCSGAGMGLLLLAGSALPINAQLVQKKLIQTGWDGPNTQQLRQNLKEIEKMPFDGLVVKVETKDDEGKLVIMSDAFSAKPWKMSWFESSIADLKAINSKTLTDNFLSVKARPPADWFDDTAWVHIVEHWRIAAEIAKAGNLKGICFDPEPWFKPYEIWRYSSQPRQADYTFEQYQVKVRQRGKEVIEAVAKVDPNLIIFTLFMNSTGGNYTATKSSNPEVLLAKSKYGQYPAFINGMLDAAPPSMIFVDGCEGPGYHGNSELDFLRSSLKSP